jgi:hypothetical protein
MRLLDHAGVRARYAVWQRGNEIPGRDPDVWLCDDSGKVMCWYGYGDNRSPFGWFVDGRSKPRHL